MQNALLLTILIFLAVFSYFFMGFVRRNRATHFGNINTLRRVSGFHRFYLNPMILIVKILLIILIYLAATDSIIVYKQQPILNTDYVILLDASSSMAKSDLPPSRLEAAKEISKNWLNLLPSDAEIGYIAFAQDIQTFVPLTTDRTALAQRIDETQINYDRIGTSVDFAISYGISLLNTSTNNKSVLLFTDGTESYLQDTIAQARSANVKIFTFGIGTEQMIDLPDEILAQASDELLADLNSLELNFTILEEISNYTGGTAYRVSNISSLRESIESATLEDINLEVNSGYYVLLLIAFLSIAEFIIYSKFGAL